MPINSLLRLALAILVAISIGSIAHADDRCDVSLAADLGRNPPPHSTPAKDRFRIFWHVSTQIEDIADAHQNKAALSDIRDVQALVDGYYFAMVGRSPVSYWPGRPLECSINFLRVTDNSRLDVLGKEQLIGKDGGVNRQSCLKEAEKFRLGIGEKDQEALQFKAAGRALRNLRIAEEQERGKEILGAFTINNRYMNYDETTDQVVLSQLPNTVCLFSREGIVANSYMIYQEPSLQLKGSTHVWIPRQSADGKPVRSANPSQDIGPENPRVYDLVEDAFRKKGVPLDGIYANFRRWNRNKTPDVARQLTELREIRGFNFEGGPAVLAKKPQKLRQFSEGVAWTLKNTSENVSILMPGYWETDSIGSEAEIDTLPQRTRDYVVTLNKMVGKIMGLPKGQNAFCTGRVILIPASYGNPMHVKTLPSMRNGRPAGTVTGNIRMLADLRKELCGG